MQSSEAIKALKPDMGAVERLSRDFSLTGIAAFALTGKAEAVHIRAFAPAFGVPEDPVTGSANGSLPSYLERFGLLDRTGREYVSMQAWSWVATAASTSDRRPPHRNRRPVRDRD